MAKVPGPLGLTLVLALALGACASPPAPPPEPSPPLAVTREPDPAANRVAVASRAGPGDLAVARVGGTEIRRSDIGDFAIRYYRDQANEILTHLIDERIIEAEAARHGIRIPDGLLDTEVDAELRERERSVKAEFGARATMEEYLRDRYGVTVAEHRADLARLLGTRLLRDRVIRYFEVVTDRVLARDAVFATESDARAAAAAARGGADLAVLAREKGVHPGIDLPPFVREEISPPELGDLLFSLKEGEIPDPVAVTEAAVTTWHVFRLVRRMPGRDVSYAAVREEIEAGLEGRGIESYEYLQWARQVRDRYGAEVLR